MFNTKLFKMKKTILLGLLITGFLASCSKDDDKNAPIKFDGSETAIREFVTPALVDSMRSLGMAINSGNTPPQIGGNYHIVPILQASNRPSDAIGSYFEEYDCHFRNQKNDNLTVDFSYEGPTEQGLSTESFISGSGNKFSAYLKANSTISGLTAQSVIVVSGEISEAGIMTYQMAVFMLDNGGNNTIFIENREGRIFNDSNNLGVRLAPDSRPAFITNTAFGSMTRK